MYKEVRQKIIDIDLNTLFAYKTFSDPVKGERFRIIFKTDVPIFSWDLARCLLFGLEQIFPEYFDPACKNVNRIYHGGNKLIKETHSLFGTSVELDKYFKILLQVFKSRYQSNYIRHLEQFAKNTGIVIRNNAFAIRTVELTDDEIQELRKNELDTYNKDFMKDYHFSISAETHKDFFRDENFDENIGTYYIYILKYDDFVKNETKVFYEICMSADKIKIPQKRKVKATNEDLTEQEEIYEVHKQKVKLDTIQIKDWKQVEDKCQLFKIFIEGQRRLHHNELFTLCTSLSYFVGGEKRFLETIDRFPSLYNEDKDLKWKATFDYNKRQNYNPTSCNLYCPFANTCKHLKNMRDTVAPKNGIYLIKNIDFVDISDIEQQLEQELKTFYSKGGYYII